MGFRGDTVKERTVSPVSYSCQTCSATSNHQKTKKPHVWDILQKQVAERRLRRVNIKYNERALVRSGLKKKEKKSVNSYWDNCTVLDMNHVLDILE